MDRLTTWSKGRIEILRSANRSHRVERIAEVSGKLEGSLACLGKYIMLQSLGYLIIEPQADWELEKL